MDVLQLLALSVVVIIVFWFLLLRPQQKARRQQQDMVQSLRIGDEIISAGGLVGRVTRLPDGDGWIGFELAPGVEVKLLTVAISHCLPAEEAKAQAADEGGDG